MEDMSQLDEKNSGDTHVYDCPYCNRRNVKYQVVGHSIFDSSNNKTCYLWFVECSSCNKKSWHLSYDGHPPV
jgi:hypothetical protein